MNDAARQVGREGQATHLVGHHRGGDALIGQGGHGLQEVLAVAHHPGGAHDVVLRRRGHRRVATRLRLAVCAQGRGILVLEVHVLRAIENVLRGDVDHRDAVSRRLAGQNGRARRVCLPGRAPTLGSLSAVHVRPRGRVDHDIDVIPRQRRHRLGVGDRHLRQIHARDREARLGQGAHQLASQLAIRARHEGAAPGGDRGRERRHVRHSRVSLVLVRQDRLLERDRPIHGGRLVRQVEERVTGVGRPVVVHQVRVRRVRLQRLVGVAHALGDEDGDTRINDRGVHGSKRGSLAQVHPRAKDAARGDRDELVPRLRVDTSGHPDLVVERNVVLHGAEIRQAQRDHLLALPVLLEPASVIAVNSQVDAQKAGDRRSRDPQGLSSGRHCSSSMCVGIVRT